MDDNPNKNVKKWKYKHYKLYGKIVNSYINLIVQYIIDIITNYKMMERRSLMDVKKGDIVLADLSGAAFSEQGKKRPVLIVQNDIGNKYSPTTIVVPLTTTSKKRNQITHTVIEKENTQGLKIDSMALCEQVRTIDKRRIKSILGRISNPNTMCEVYRACLANFG